MKEVTWGDVFMSSIVVSILMGSLAVLSYFALHKLFRWELIPGVDPTYTVVVVAGFVGSLLVVKAYPGPKSDFGPVRAWVALAFSVPALGFVAFVMRGINSEAFSGVVSFWMMQISVLTMIIVLSIYLHTNDTTISVEAARTRDF